MAIHKKLLKTAAKFAVPGMAVGGTLVSGALAYGQKQTAKQAELHRARIQGINNNIQKSQAISNSYIKAGEMQLRNKNENSTQDAIVAAQGRRGSSGSSVAIKKEKKRLLDKNTTKVMDNAKTTGDLLDINTLGAKSAAQAANDARDTNFIVNQVSSLSSLVAMDWS